MGKSCTLPSCAFPWARITHEPRDVSHDRVKARVTLNDYTLVERENVLGVMEGMPPASLISDYGAFLGDGVAPVIHRVQSSSGLLGWMFSVRGNPEALPGLMFGFLFARDAPPMDLDVLYKDVRREFGGTWRVHLPPSTLGPRYLASFKGKLSRYESHDAFILRGDGEADYESQLKPEARQNIEKAKRAGISIKAGLSGAQVMQFLSVHLRNNGRQKLPPLTRDDISRFSAIFGERLVLHIAFDANRPQAAVLAVHDQGYCLVLDHASATTQRDSAADYLCYWSMISSLAGKGVNSFELGFGSGKDDDVSLVKTRLGAEQARCFTVGAR